jgi:regulator of protease activity HflC (stomatin/prohibitin superfamily)
MFKRVVGYGLTAVAVIVGLSILLGSWGTIDQGERGVKLRNGAVVSVLEPGLYFKMPFLESVHDIPVQSFNKRYENVASYSKDQQPANMSVSVNYRAAPDKVSELYSTYGSLDNAVARLIDPKVFEQVKNVFGQFNAITAVQERPRLNSEIESALRDSLKEVSGGNSPIFIESFQIENIDFSDVYETSVEERMKAEVEVAKLRQNLEREKVQADIAVTQANGRANSVRTEAQAQADAIKLKGEADAQAIRMKGDALRENPNIISLTATQTWDGKLPTMMVPGGTLPFIEVGKGLPQQ